MPSVKRLLGFTGGRTPQARKRPALQMESLEGREVLTVTYFGGNLLKNVEAQAVYLGSGWGSQTQTKATMESFLADVTNSTYMDAMTNAGYGVGRGSAAPGVVDNAALGKNLVLSDAWIQSRLQSDITAGLTQQPNANRLYIIYVQPNVAVNLGAGQGVTNQGVLGYHGAFGGRDAAGRAATIRYAVIAYPGGTVGNSSMGVSATDQMTSVTSHELAEAVTDPDVNYARMGWYDPRLGEIADMTENNPKANVRLNGYLVQLVAGKNGQLLSLPASPTPTPAPTPTPTPPVSSLTTTISTLVAGPVKRSWWFGPATETITVIVAPSIGTALPTGTVQLNYNGKTLGTATVKNVNGQAVATFNATFYASGIYNFSAVYSGSSSFATSKTSTVSVVV